ncbi:MAG: prolipoprotein diacylglyceryl transferase [Acidobacteriota bacterium]
MHPVIHISSLSISSYAVMMSLAVIAFIALVLHRAEREGLDANRLAKLAPWGLLSMLIGARLFYVVVNLRDYASRPADILRFWRGGIVSYGGFLAFFIFCTLSIKYWLRMPVWHCTDIATPALAAAVCFWRIGCFLGGCCYGAPTDLPWAVLFPRFAPPDARYRGFLWCAPPDTPGVFRHPTELYEALIGLTGFFLFSWALKKVSRRDGVLFWACVGAYAWLRVAVEVVRDDPRGQLVLLFGPGVQDHVRWIEVPVSRYLPSHTAELSLWLSTAQIVSIALLLVSAGFIINRLGSEPVHSTPGRTIAQ